MSRKRPAETAPGRDKTAFDLGVFSESKKVPLHVKALDKVLLKTDGKDIIKKSTTRKGRYLIAIAGQLAPVAGGKMGTLAELDSQTPVLYLDCPGGGRIKLAGRLTFPKNKYITLRVGGKHALCEDVFDMLVVFSTACWIGTKEENPEEEQMAWPESVLAAEPAADELDPLDPLAAPAGKPGKQRGSPRPAGGAGEDESSEEEEEPFTQAATQPTPQLRGSARRSAAKRPDYTEGGLSDEREQSGDSQAESQDQSEGSDNESAQPPAKRSKGEPHDLKASRPDKAPAKHAGPPGKASKAPSRGAEQAPGTAQEPPKGPGEASRRKSEPSPASRSKGDAAGRKVRSRAAAISLLSSDSDGPQLPEVQQRQPTKRAAKAAASKVLMFHSQGDDSDSVHETSSEPDPSDDGEYD